MLPDQLLRLVLDCVFTGPSAEIEILRAAQSRGASPDEVIYALEDCLHKGWIYAIEPKRASDRAMYGLTLCGRDSREALPTHSPVLSQVRVSQNCLTEILSNGVQIDFFPGREA